MSAVMYTEACCKKFANIVVGMHGVVCIGNISNIQVGPRKTGLFLTVCNSRIC